MIWLNMWKLMAKKQENGNIRIGELEQTTKYGKPEIILFIKYLDTNKRKTIKVLKCSDHFRAIINDHADVCGKTEEETAKALENLI